MDISIDEILEEEFIMNMNSESSYNQKLKPIYDLPYVEFLDFIKSIIVAADKNGQMKMIHYLINYVDCFELYEKTIPKLIFEQSSLEIFNHYLTDTKYAKVFIKYVGYRKTSELLNQKLIIMTSIREYYFKYYHTEYLKYCSENKEIKLTSKIKRCVASFIQTENQLRKEKNVLGLHSCISSSESITVNIKRICKCKNYQDIKINLLSILYHEIGHAIQEREINIHLNYRTYRILKDILITIYDPDFYQFYHDFFELEIDAALKVYQIFIKNDNQYLNWGIYGDDYEKKWYLNRISEKYHFVDQYGNTFVSDPNIPSVIGKLQHNKNGKLKSMRELVLDKITKKYNRELDLLYCNRVDYEDLYYNFIISRLNDISCEELKIQIVNYTKDELKEILEAIDYINAIVIFLNKLCCQYYRKVENLKKMALSKRKLLLNYQKNLYLKRNIISNRISIMENKKMIKKHFK